MGPFAAAEHKDNGMESDRLHALNFNKQSIESVSIVRLGQTINQSLEAYRQWQCLSGIDQQANTDN